MLANALEGLMLKAIPSKHVKPLAMLASAPGSSSQARIIHKQAVPAVKALALHGRQTEMHATANSAAIRGSFLIQLIICIYHDPALGVLSVSTKSWRASCHTRKCL